MNVFILTEGSREIGFGHITRCLSIYQAFREMGIMPQLIVNGDESVTDLLRGTKYIFLKWHKAQNVPELIHADIALIDSYKADHDVYLRIAERVALPVYIDDNCRINYPGGIVLNGTISAENLIEYPANDKITYLLGSTYTPLRREFWNAPGKKIRKHLKSIMITFGGDDYRNMTPAVLKLLAERYPMLNKRIIIGKGFQNIERVEKAKDDKTELIYYPDAEVMKKTMIESDIAVSAAGQTLYELAKVGTPTIAVAVADNQMNNVKGWQEAGFIEYAGWWEDRDVLNNIHNKISLLENHDQRSARSIRGSSEIDGRGAINIARECMNTFLKDRLVLRMAETKDLHNTYNLSNEKDVRNNSFSQSRITLKGHKEWFNQKLKDRNCLFLVAYINDELLGQIRLERDGEKTVVISISLKKKYRGLGIGTTVLFRSMMILKENYDDVENVKAYIKKRNTASVGFFKRNGFKFKKELIIRKQNAVEYQYDIS